MMMNNNLQKFAFLLFFITLSIILYAQSEKIVLRGEGSNKAVKLLWIPQVWNKEIKGFEIKRRETVNNVTSEWKTISALIETGITSSKNLTIIEKDQEALKALDEKRTKLLNSKANDPFINVNFSDLLLDNKKIMSFAINISLDYSYAQLSGFGYSDRDVKTFTIYEYALYCIYQNGSAKLPAATYKWDGKEPNLNVVMKKFNLEPNKKNKTLEASFYFEKEEFKNSNITGFNIYKKETGKEPQKRNNGILLLSPIDKDLYCSFLDTIEDTKKPFSYALISTSPFGNQGNAIEIDYNPANYTDTIPSVSLSHNTPFGADFIKTGITFNWNFDVNFNKFIKGFVVERDLLNTGDFVEISSTLSSENREYVDKTVPNLVKEQFVAYRLKTIVTDKIYYLSNLVSIEYNPIEVVGKPLNLSGQFVKDLDNNYILLKWQKPSDAKENPDYAVFCDRGSNVLAQENFDPIKGNEFKYNIGGNNGLTYKFSIAALKKGTDTNDYGVMSDTVVVFIPTTYVFTPQNITAKLTGNKISLKWQYKYNFVDLIGFCIYMNNSKLADETSLKVNQTEWTSEELPKGSYEFKVKAITKYKYESPFSEATIITIK